MWKLLGTNILVFFVVWNLFYWGIPIVATVSEQIKTLTARAAATAPTKPPNPAFSTDDQKWLPTFRRELAKRRMHYASFIGWRSDHLEGETIAIRGPFHQRLTINAGARTEKTAYFFGGSTMWGFDSNNETTIPSYFSALTGIYSENFADLGWTAHQNLVLLLQLIQEGHRPDLVIFFDGANDVEYKCQIEHTPRSYPTERLMKRLLGAPPAAKPNTFSHYFAPIRAVAEKVKLELDRIAGSLVRPTPWTQAYDCSTNPEKASEIAENLLRDWHMAQQLVESYGGRFAAFLQPVAFYGKALTDNIELADVLRAEFDAVYPLVERKTAEDAALHSSSTTLDDAGYVYTDFRHLSPRGTRRIAQEIASVLNLR